MEPEMFRQSCFSYKELNCVNVVLKLPGLCLLVVVVLLQSDQTSHQNSGEKKGSKEEFLASD